jgi:beta-phosphoglucomutase-like phosphatase (HAD superfamily)
MTRAVLWDLDGTLVDSEEFHWLSWRDTMRAEGVELTYPQFLASFGQRNDRIVPAWLGPDVDVARMNRIGEEKEAEYRRLAEVHGLQPLPGAVHWLATLKAAGWKQAIASSAPLVNVEMMVRAAGPSRCIVVEDAAAGVEGARRGGMRCIGVTKNGRLNADVFVESLADLAPDAFDQLLGSSG